MFPNAARTAIPPLPPDVQAQQHQPAAPMFAQMGSQMGANSPDPSDIMTGQIAKLEAWLQETAPLVDQTNPAWGPLLIPIAQAGKALLSEVQQLQQRNSGPSPQVMGSVPPNVPGNIPGARPAM